MPQKPEGRVTVVDASNRRAKLSEMIVEFASPLIELDPSGPPNIAALRSIMQLAEMAWNLPVLQKEGTLAYARAKRSFDEAMAAMPPIASRALRQLLSDRKDRFGALPFFVTVEVKGTSLEHACVAVEARR